MEKNHPCGKKIHADLITDNNFFLTGLSHLLGKRIEINSFNVLYFLHHYIPGDGTKIIDMNSWERFPMTPYHSLGEKLKQYHGRLLLLTHNNRQKMVAELLYPEVKTIRPETFFEEIQFNLIGQRPEDVRLLTPRQQQIILLLSSGADCEETSSVLRISAKTLSTHLRCVLSKSSFKKFSYFCAAITPYAQDVAAASLRERTHLKNLSADTSCRKTARALLDALSAN
ncbi:MAG: hypothetical protein G3W58_22325 [Pantoea ananatis]|nr:hypothetical protein [Pantoea ananatis]